MKNKISKLLVVLVVFIIFLSGCSGSRYSQRDNDRGGRNHHGVDNRHYRGY